MDTLSPEARFGIRLALQVMASAVRGVGLLAAFGLFLLAVSGILITLQSNGVKEPLAPLQAFGWNGNWSFSSQSGQDVSDAVFWTGVAAALLGFLYQAAMRALGRTVTDWDSLKASIKVLAGLGIASLVVFAASFIGQPQAVLLGLILFAIVVPIVIAGSLAFVIAFGVDFAAGKMQAP